MKFYIEYMDSKKGFRTTRKEFATMAKAVAFIERTFEQRHRNSDMIKTI